MILYGVKVGVDEEGVIKKAISEVTDNGKTVRNVTIDIDKEYKVIPYKNKKTKHFNRSGVVKSIKRNEDNEVKVHLLFSDTGTLGWVNVEDLESVKK